jgi:Fe-S cluster assembly protein SufB
MSEGKEISVKDSIDRGTVDAARGLEADKYAEGFVTDIEMELAPKGLSEDTVRYISAKKEEPEWMLQWRLEAFQRWKEMIEPTWAMINYPKIDYQDAHYYAEPKGGAKYKSIADVPKEILDTYAKLGIPLKRAGSAARRRGGDGDGCGRARDAQFAWRWMPCSTASALRRPSAPNC